MTLVDLSINASMSDCDVEKEQRRRERAGANKSVNFGSSLGIHTKLHAIPENTGFEGVSLRVKRYALQDKAKNILNKKVVQRGNKWAYVHRVNYCLHSRLNSKKDIAVYYNVDREKANYGNLQRCGSVWCCPVCSAQISEIRRYELKTGIHNWTSSGGFVYLVTFTNRHHCGDYLADLLAGQKKAFVKFWQKRAVTEMLRKLSYVGRIVATEVTYNDTNGWHPHYHMLFFFKHSVNMQALQSFLALHWQDVCIKTGLKAPTLVNGVDVRDGTFASQYATKWGLDSEMTKGHLKKGLSGGLTPFDLLRLSENNHDNYARLFSDFADVFKGKQQLNWSNGLKDLLGIQQKSDDEIILETDEKSNLICNIAFLTWTLILKHKSRAYVLDLAELDYLDNGSRLNEYILNLISLEYG